MPAKRINLRLLPSLLLSAFLFAGSLSSCGTQNDEEPIVRQTIAKENTPLDSSRRPEIEKKSKKDIQKEKPKKIISYGKNEPVTI